MNDLNLKKDWTEFKKELTWNHVKMGISVLLPLLLVIYAWTYWCNIITNILNIDSVIINPTIESEVVMLCLTIGLLTPLYFGIFWSMDFGLWVGRITHFYKRPLTNFLIFDDVSYSLGKMPVEQREKLKEIIASYKSKEQLRKEKYK